MTFVLAVALLTNASPTCSLSEPATAAGLLMAERGWVGALEARDVAALDCRLAAHFVDTNWRGELVARDAMLAALPKRPSTSLALSKLDARVYGVLGIVHGINTQTDPDGRIVGKVRFTDVFIRETGGWRALAAQETLVRDGAGD